MKELMKIRGTVVILERDRKFLLQHRSDIKGIENPNLWGLFGGMVKEKETFVEGLIREIREELELDLEKENLEKVLEYENEKKHITIFKAKLKKNLSELKLNEGQDMKLFSKEEIIKKEDITPGLDRLFARFF